MLKVKLSMFDMMLCVQCQEILNVEDETKHVVYDAV